MQSFENRMLQLETKPNNRISENSVQPQEDEGKSPKTFPTAWITAPSQLNPDRDKIFDFSTNVSDPKFGVTCPKSLLENFRRDVLPIIFQPFTTACSQAHDDVLLAALRRIAADPSHSSIGWLGNFSLNQMDHLERLFEPHG